MKKLIAVVFACLLFCADSLAQNAAPFAAEIAAFKKADSIAPQSQGAILFVGSSSFRLWNGVEQTFPNKTIINRGFGGSSLVDVIRYANDIIFPYNPKQIVIYCGENDIASSDTLSAVTVATRFEELFTLIRSRLPDVPVAFVSIKPSPSRWQMRERMQAANKAIKDFLKSQKRTKYVDVWDDMLNDNGEPRAEIFVGDKLHMNEQGYAIWTKKIVKVLK